MRRRLKLQDPKVRAVAFGLLPCVFGLAAARAMLAADRIWLSTAGDSWPIVVAAAAAAILVRLMFAPFEDRTFGLAAWLALAWAWFYLPLWATAPGVPHDAAVVGRDGRVHVVRDEIRDPALQVRLLTGQPGTRIVRHVSGRLVESGLELEWRYSVPYVAARRDGEDLAAPLARAAGAILAEQAALPRAARIALTGQRVLQDRVLRRICGAATGDGSACPLELRLAPQKDATAPGGIWSTVYSEDEAIAEKHVPTLLRLLTQPDSPLLRRDAVFALLLDLAADDAAPLSRLAQQSHRLDDEQFDRLIGRILAAPGCGSETILVIARASRLTPQQRLALRAKALREASIAALLAQAAPLRLSDPDIAQLAARMRVELAADAGIAVRALEVLGERLPADVQRDAVAAIVQAGMAHTLAALSHVNFSAALRRDLMARVLADARYDDFSGLSKEKLLALLTPAELRALIAMAVKRAETSTPWLEFAQRSLPVGAMTAAEQKTLVTELLFRGPKLAFEFVSENRHFLAPAEVDEVTRDYTRTITPDFCLHLSHRNATRKTDYFSAAQLQIFRDCAAGK